MSEHTPLPWTVQESEQGIYPIWAKCGPLNVQPATAHGRADADLIVDAVNSHDALVETLLQIRKIARSGGNIDALNRIYYLTSAKQQADNSSVPIVIAFGGQEKNITEWGRELGLTKTAMHYRISNWSIEKALTAPVQTNCQNKRSIK